MINRSRPGVDRDLDPQSGMTRDGQPLSFNRAPAPDLTPWIARLYAAEVEAPPEHTIVCGLFNDTSLIRIQTRGLWTAHTKDGVISHGRAALAFGPQTRRMPVTVKGSFTSIGVSLCPGTGRALSNTKSPDYVDRLVACEEWGLPGEAALELLEQGGDVETRLDALEGLIRQVIQAAGANLPDPVSARFEAQCFSDPSVNIADFAEDFGVDQRRLERIVRRDFGMAPKQVLRRARALDMASQLRGVADCDEADEQALRYYDQSHLIREFVQLFGMTPRQFVATPQPILTSALESRQARRLEVLKRLAPGEARPWHGPDDRRSGRGTPQRRLRRRSVEQRADRTLVGNPPDRLADQRGDAEDADGLRVARCVGRQDGVGDHQLLQRRGIDPLDRLARQHPVADIGRDALRARDPSAPAPRCTACRPNR